MAHDEEFSQWYSANITSEFFASWELLTKGGAHVTRGSRAFGLNTDPPRELWPNCIELVSVLDEIRRRSGSPLYLTSVYRSAAYNKAIKGAPKSTHMEFMAADVTSALTPRKIHTIADTLRKEKLFKGGLGHYRTFTHIDTRGRNVDF